MTLGDYILITRLKSGKVSKDTHTFIHRQLNCSYDFDRRTFWVESELKG